MNRNQQNSNYLSLTALVFQRLFWFVINQIKIQDKTLMSTNSADSQPQICKERFDIQQQIGRGQFGSVYRAVEKESNTQIALKIISKEKVIKANFYSQLKREIEIQSRLKHKHICQLYSYFHDQQNVYILLEYCKHGSLAVQIHQKKSHFSDKKIASILQQLIYAVAYMHERHVMHRDLKLQNILLDEDYNIKISDFGFCRHHIKTNPHKRNTFCGTMEYISPQMVKQQPYTDSIDVYCIGIILYQLFYLTSPFLGADDEETFQNIKEKQVVFRDDFRVIPDEAKELILKLLDKNPSKRPMAKNLFQNKFITNYLSSGQNTLGQRKRRFTQESFIKWQEQMGIGAKATKDICSQTENRNIQSDPHQECRIQGEIKKEAQPRGLEQQEQLGLQLDDEPKPIDIQEVPQVWSA